MLHSKLTQEYGNDITENLGNLLWAEVLKPSKPKIRGQYLILSRLGPQMLRAQCVCVKQ